MIRERDVEGLLGLWLGEGPEEVPDVVVEQALVTIDSTNQVRAPFGRSWRGITMPKFASLAIGTTVVLLVAVLGVGFLGGGNNTAPGNPLASPSPSASAHAGVASPSPTATSSAVASTAPTSSSAAGAIDTRDWLAYTSTRYGYTISHPPSWRVGAANRDATSTTAPVDLPDSSADHFIDLSASYTVLVTAFAESFTDSGSVDDWVNHYYEPSTPQAQQCYHSIEIEPITIDGHVGRIATNDPCAAAEAFVLVDGRIYGFGVWRENQEPLFRAFLSTVRFPQGGAPDSSSEPSFATPPPLPALGWKPYHSDQYGFDMAYPAGWSVAPAKRAWTYAADATDWLSPAHDAFLAPDQSVRVSAWSVPIDQGTTFEDPSQLATWVQSYCERTEETPCTGISARAVPLCLERRDCHPGLLVPFAQDTLAFFTGGIAPPGKVVVVAVWRPESDESVAPYGGARHVLEAFLSTMEVWPESVPLPDRKVRDVPGPSSTP
jgi:hypothetical protein